MENNDEIKKETKKFNFKEYYDNNPEFKKRHLEKCLTKVLCECGRMTNRCSLSRHRKSKIHMRQMGEVEKKDDKFTELQNQIIELKTKFANLEKQK